MASCIKPILLTFIVICIASVMVAGDVVFPPGKRCFVSIYCPTMPKLCDHFCKASSGFCFKDEQVCCCN
ncbi:LCR-like protein [Medicago truncatula]|uniref:LCR-like protein n=1 Tax=Medicago truncatula TaxID=3880 RepID=G7I7P1_MEDTR|nr:LCR-like protein [Medicago truncatula]KEH39878.1 LCR-like protein [Medicago truncatula]KEH39879.1 LCR-like protein [Medicago truncatula]